MLPDYLSWRQISLPPSLRELHDPLRPSTLTKSAWPSLWSLDLSHTL